MLHCRDSDLKDTRKKLLPGFVIVAIVIHVMKMINFNSLKEDFFLDSFTFYILGWIRQFMGWYWVLTQSLSLLAGKYIALYQGL